MQVQSLCWIDKTWIIVVQKQVLLTAVRLKSFTQDGYKSRKTFSFCLTRKKAILKNFVESLHTIVCIDCCMILIITKMPSPIC